MFTYPYLELEKYLYFDESGEPKKGVQGKKEQPVFFIGCIHTDSKNKINSVHKIICEKIGKEDLHYEKLSKKQQKSAWFELLKSDLKLDVAISYTRDFDLLKKNFEEKEKAGNFFEIISTGAKYKYFVEMCQTEMYAKLAWLLFAEFPNKNYEGYERQLDSMEKQKITPEIEYDRSPSNKDGSERVNQGIWCKIHLERQLKNRKIFKKPQQTNSEGVQLADILVSGFKDRYNNKLIFPRNSLNYKYIPISVFFHQTEENTDSIIMATHQVKEFNR